MILFCMWLYGEVTFRKCRLYVDHWLWTVNSKCRWQETACLGLLFSFFPFRGVPNRLCSLVVMCLLIIGHQQGLKGDSWLWKKKHPPDVTLRPFDGLISKICKKLLKAGLKCGGLLFLNFKSIFGVFAMKTPARVYVELSSQMVLIRIK